jgi:hypothetical protein
MKPLTAAEKAVFGEDAVRDPVTGAVVENGHGSVNHEQRIAAGLRREATCRGIPAAPQPAQEPPRPAPERIIDTRAVHPYPQRIQ